jgi:hypothetical protein
LDILLSGWALVVLDVFAELIGKPGKRKTAYPANRVSKNQD